MSMNAKRIAVLLLGLAIITLAAAADDRALLQSAVVTGASPWEFDDLSRGGKIGGTNDDESEWTGIWFGRAPGEPRSPSTTVDETWLDAVLALSAERLPTLSTVTLDASGSSSSAGVILFEWDLDGDGTYDAVTHEATFETSFGQNGVHALCVRVTDLRGNTATSTPAQLEVTNREPEAAFSLQTSTISDREPAAFIDQSSDRDGEIVSWSWDFGDGTISSDVHPIHAYGVAGSYDVTLSVTDDDGATATTSQTVAVENSLPEAGFAVSSTRYASGEAVLLFDESIDPSPNGAIVHVGWDFGDGAYSAGGPSTDGTYEHVYDEPGRYLVTLYVVDDQGGLSRAQSLVTIDG